MKRSTLIPKLVVAMIVAMVVSFLAGQLSVGQRTAAALAPARQVKEVVGCTPAAGDWDPPMEPPSPYGFNQPG